MLILIISQKYTEVKKKKVEKKGVSNSGCFKRHLKVEYKTNHTEIVENSPHLVAMTMPYLQHIKLIHVFSHLTVNKLWWLMRIKPAGRASECKQQINLLLNRGVLQGHYTLQSN